MYVLALCANDNLIGDIGGLWLSNKFSSNGVIIITSLNLQVMRFKKMRRCSRHRPPTAEGVEWGVQIQVHDKNKVFGV